MIFNKFMQEFAHDLNGQFSEYDRRKSVTIIPLGKNRFQTILSFINTNEQNGREDVLFSSKVCNLKPGLNLEELLRANADFCYARFVISENSLRVEASVYLDVATEPLMKDLILEIAHVADEWEYKLTGVDIH